MSVKKIGSKLAQGVRQVKAQQVSALVEALETRMPSPASPAPSPATIAKPAARASSTPGAAKTVKSVKSVAPARTAPGMDKPVAVRAVLKPAPIDAHLSEMGHPTRVWPD